MNEVRIHREDCPQRLTSPVHGRWVSSELQNIMETLALLETADKHGEWDLAISIIYGGLYTWKHRVEHSGSGDPWDCICGETSDEP